MCLLWISCKSHDLSRSLQIPIHFLISWHPPHPTPHRTLGRLWSKAMQHEEYRFAWESKLQCMFLATASPSLEQISANFRCAEEYSFILGYTLWGMFKTFCWIQMLFLGFFQDCASFAHVSFVFHVLHVQSLTERRLCCWVGCCKKSTYPSFSRISLLSWGLTLFCWEQLRTALL